jgi:hypothetical protein
MPEWDDLLADARAKRDAQTEELRRLEAARRVTADDLAVRRAKAEGDYVRTVAVFQRELHPSDYPLVQLTRTKKPLVGSQFKKARVLFIARAGSEWWEVNKGYGPRSNYSRTLVVGPEIKPGIWGGDSLSYEQYRLLASTSEPIHGLKAMFANHASFGESLEALPNVLLRALADWAAEHRPNLKLRMDE